VDIDEFGEIIRPQTASEAATALRDRLVKVAPNRALEFIEQLIEYLIEEEKLKRFATAGEKERGVVEGMGRIQKEIAGIRIEIEQRLKRGINE